MMGAVDRQAWRLTGLSERIWRWAEGWLPPEGTIQRALIVAAILSIPLWALIGVGIYG